MQLIRYQTKSTACQGAIAALGNFDGIHKGHQALIKQAIKEAKAKGLPSMLITFHPSPAVFFKGKRMITLTSFREKWLRLKALGLDYVVLLPFNQALSKLTPEEFIRHILQNYLKLQGLWVGENFRFGHARQGCAGDLQKIQALNCKILPLKQEHHNIISSTAIRALLKAGRVGEASQLLGYTYRLIGKVVKNQGRGRQLGFPTANISLYRRCVALQGVFSVRVQGALQTPCYGVANIGVRPTVDGSKPWLEVHLFDFNQDIYGNTITVEFIEKIRDEQKFNSLDELIRQIKQDITQAKKSLHYD